MNIFLSTWILLAGGLFFALPMIYFRVKDPTELEEETLYAQFYFKFSTRPLFRFLGPAWMIPATGKPWKK